MVRALLRKMHEAGRRFVALATDMEKLIYSRRGAETQRKMSQVTKRRTANKGDGSERVRSDGTYCAPAPTGLSAFAFNCKLSTVNCLLFLAAFALTPLVIGAQAAHYRTANGVVLQDRTATPGAVRTHDAKAICSESFHTADERHTTEAMKSAVYKAYGVTRNQGMCAGGCEVDHLISLEIGGADSIENLWPQPSKGIGYHTKDKLENRLHALVCAGKLSLDDAQKCISEDWYACGLKLGVFYPQGNLKAAN